MAEYEKSDYGSHSIESHNVLLDKETGRVVAVFYNDYDLDDILKQMDLATIKKGDTLSYYSEEVQVIEINGQKYVGVV